ncbi:MAG: hypothetical protein H6Q15_789 [Bacteroidetes bacterium]|nr:hypothetical protein [Bacteroidota bacterium]
MKESFTEIDLLRNKVINATILTILILLLPIVFVSTFRFINYGWQNYYDIYIIETLLIALLYFFRNKIPNRLKTHSIAAVSIAFGLIGTSIFSITGGNFQSIIGIIIISLLYGKRIGIYYVVLAISGYSTIGLLIVFNIINPNIDFNSYNHGLFPWLNAIALYTTITLLAVYTIGLFYKHYIGSLAEIEKSKIKFKTVFDIMQIGITITNKQGHVIDCNEESEILLDVTKEEHLKRDYSGNSWKIIRTDYSPMPDIEYASIRTMNEGKAVKNIEMGIVKSNDEITWLSVNAIPINIDDYGVVVTYTDITELKKEQEKIDRASQELTKLNSDKDKFIRILAHDLKNPFNSLIGFSTLLLENIDSFDIDTIKQQIGIINDTSIKTYDMLEEVLLWLKSQSGQLIFSPSNISFFEICNEVILSSKIIANDKNITINFHCLNNSSKIFVDSNMTKTIMRNLVSNAVKFTMPNGEINIYEEIVGNEMIITISDNGIGISKDNIEKLWNPMQTDKTLGTVGERGTGLGLSICKEFVERQSGRIWVESELGKGSSFKFSMPISNKDIL